MPKRPHYTITPADVGKSQHRIHGRTWTVDSWIGQVLPLDVGKRVYLTGPDRDVLGVENSEQLADRLAVNRYHVRVGYRFDDGMAYSYPQTHTSVTVEACDENTARGAAIDRIYEMHAGECSHVRIEAVELMEREA